MRNWYRVGVFALCLVTVLAFMPFGARAQEAPPISDGSQTDDSSAPQPTEAPPAFQQGYAPTYTIRATREGLVGKRTANGHRIVERDWFVALPSWKVLSSRGGSEFQVRVTYEDKSIVLPVWDVGPWNTNDEYWTPERRFYRDLPVGMPMAQAAVQFGYNGGLDMFGRKITLGNGIDIADGAFWDGLGMRSNTWVRVTFLWMGLDPGPAGLVDASVGSAAYPPGTVIVDNGSGGYTNSAKIEWYDSFCGLNGKHDWTFGTSKPELSENTATWNANISQVGYYEIMAFIPPCGRPATRAAIYKVNTNGAERDVWLDQALQSGRWASLGIYNMMPGSSSVRLSDVTGDDGQSVRFDAVMWVPRYDSMPPSSWIQEIQPMDGGAYVVQWAGVDDVSGISSYDVQYRINGGEWQLWQSGTGANMALFSPVGSGEYQFRARARDWMGKEAAWSEDSITFKSVVVP